MLETTPFSGVRFSVRRHTILEPQQLKDRLDLIARVGTLLLVALYGAGFLVVSFHDATFGIVEFGFIRTRLLSAGIIFGVFFGLPFLEASKIYGLFGLQATIRGIPEGDEKVPKWAFYDWSNRILLFFISAWAIAWVIRPLLGDYDVSRGLIAVNVGALALLATILFLRRRLGPRFPITLSLMVLSFIVLSVVGLIATKQWPSLKIIAWFAIVGWLATQMHSPIQDPRKLTQLSWPLIVLNIIGVFSFFAVFLYPQIRPVFGGGKPSRVVLEFEKPSPINNSTSMEAWLVDEVEGGYYVIRTPTDHKAIFIRKSLISAASFEPEKIVP